jgi:hypothetical protein
MTTLLHFCIFLLCTYMLVEAIRTLLKFFKRRNKGEVHQASKLDIDSIKGKKGKDLNLVIETMFSKN